MRAVYTFIAEEQATPTNPVDPWTVAEMCRTLGVSRSGYYDWVDRSPSNREVTDRMLEVEIEAIWECSARTYGVPRVTAWLAKQGFAVSGKRVARLMRRNGWEGESGRSKVRTTIVDRGAKAASDHVKREGLQPDRPEPHVVRRHHLPAHRRRLAVPRDGHRLVLPAGDRLVRRRAHAHRTRRRCLEDGGRDSRRPRRRCDLPLRPRVSVHVRGVR